MSDVPFLLGQLQAAVERAKADRKAASEGSDACKACPFPDQTAALELVRLREGIGRLAERMQVALSNMPIDCNGDCNWGPCGCSGIFTACAWSGVSPEDLRALLDDNEGDSC